MIQPASFGAGDKGGEAGTHFVFFPHMRLTIWPLKDNTQVEVTEIGSAADACSGSSCKRFRWIMNKDKYWCSAWIGGTSGNSIRSQCDSSSCPVCDANAVLAGTCSASPDALAPDGSSANPRYDFPRKRAIEVWASDKILVIAGPAKPGDGGFTLDFTSTVGVGEGVQEAVRFFVTRARTRTHTHTHTHSHTRTHIHTHTHAHAHTHTHTHSHTHTLTHTHTHTHSHTRTHSLVITYVNNSLYGLKVAALSSSHLIIKMLSPSKR